MKYLTPAQQLIIRAAFFEGGTTTQNISNWRKYERLTLQFDSLADSCYSEEESECVYRGTLNGVQWTVTLRRW